MIIEKMNKNIEMRYTYLMFAFTTTVALLAAVFTLKSLSDLYWISLFPFAIIIPFQARISYSRLSYAKMEAYINIFYPDVIKYYLISHDELTGTIGKLISIIVNYELTILSIIVAICYYSLQGDECHIVMYIIPLLLVFVVAMLAEYSRRYAVFRNRSERIYANIH